MSGTQTSTACDGTRLIMYHKQVTSAMTRFLRMPDGGVCAFEPLPPMAQMVEEDDDIASPTVKTHPASLLSRAEQWLGLPAGGLELDSEFSALVDIPGGAQTVYLARFTSIDPPHDEVGRVGGRFVVLTETRDLPPAELLLLGRAYKVIMED
jgi:hypothetical protein